jgi:hypothetical protein
VGRWLRTLLVLTGLALVGYLVAQIGPAAIWSSFVTLGWWLPVVLTLPYAVAVVVDTLAWRLLLPTPVPFLLLVRARLGGEAVSLATPTLTVGGDPLKAYLLRPHLPLGEGFASVIADKTTVVAGQVFFLLVGLAVAYVAAPPPGRMLAVMTGLLIVEVLATGGFVAVQATGALGGGGRVLGRIVHRMGLAAGERMQRGMGDLDRALAALYRDRRRRLVASAVGHTLGWAIGALEMYLVLALLGTPAPFEIALIIEAFASGVKFASFMVPAGLSFVLVRRLREIAWAVVGFLVLGVSGRATMRAPAAPPA